MAEARQKAKESLAVDSQLGRWGTAIIVSTWVIALAGVGYLVFRLLQK